MRLYNLDETKVKSVLAVRLSSKFLGTPLKAGHIVKVLLAIAKALKLGKERCFIRAAAGVAQALNAPIPNESSFADVLSNWWHGYFGDSADRKKEYREAIKEKVKAKLPEGEHRKIRIEFFGKLTDAYFDLSVEDFVRKLEARGRGCCLRAV